MDKTEGYPIGLGRNFGRSNIWTNPLAKVVDFVPLETISGPGSPDPDLARSHMKVTTMEYTKFIEIPVVLLIFLNHKLQSCDTCTRTEPILQNTTRSGTSQL